MNLKNRISTAFLVVMASGIISSHLFAQKIDLSFPYFAGKEYSFWVFKGDKADTLSVGKLDPQGRTTLVIPPRYKGYKGMSQWLLKEGGGLSMVINNENFSVSCSEAIPNDDNIIYKNSPENVFLYQQYLKQQELFQKIDAMRLSKNVYKEGEPIYTIFDQELEKLETKFEALQNETAKSPLYAARFREITDFLMGIDRKLDNTEEQKAANLGAYFANEMDIEALYTSNHWNNAINNWMEMQINVVKDDNTLIDHTRKVLARIQSDDVYTAFAEKIINLYSKYGKDELINNLSSDLAHSGKLKGAGTYIQWITAAAKGTKAPQIVGLENPSFLGKTTLLVFYQSGCGNCKAEMEELAKNNNKLQDHQIRIVSISADSDENVFKFNSSELPWNDKLCDYEGLTGKNFRNYGVMGTPTFVLVDKNGLIIGKYAQVSAVLTSLGL